MKKSDITRDAIVSIIFAIRVPTYHVRTIPTDDYPNERPIVADYKKGQFIRSTGFIRSKNVNGHHIYFRPNSSRHILIDDLDEDALDELKQDGLPPSLVVLTSKGNHQAWLTISDDELDNNIATAAARILAKKYGGDPGAANFKQLGRLPGTTNRKDIHRGRDGMFPFTRVVGSGHQRECPGAARVLDEAKEFVAVALSSSSSSFTQGGSVIHSNVLGDQPSIMTHHEALGIYGQSWDELIAKSNVPHIAVDRSRADYNIARMLRSDGFNNQEAMLVIHAGSEKAHERGMKYVEDTVGRAYT
jgi:hypothetical protein